MHGYSTATAAATAGARYVPLDTGRVIANQTVAARPGDDSEPVSSKADPGPAGAAKPLLSPPHLCYITTLRLDPEAVAPV
ncbi:hypothetical protein ACIBQ6_28380 [Nonomuraea sp. NPDC049655]|uniref:hypothetical protein n=1 Tax=Nonomuraea sp. NPDC049655 TaxID=3364355 RepID=UPI0037BAD6CB